MVKLLKVATIIGARPQFVKAAVVSRAFNQCCPRVEEILIHTGQHYDASMSEVFFEELDIPKPHYNLGIGGGSHGEMTGRQLEAIEKVLLTELPNLVLVYGDTNSTLAGALAATKLHINVAHVEAGLRSFNRRMPEEINRVLVDHISAFLFAPTEISRSNLEKEGIPQESIYLTGDVMYDAALHYRDRAREPDWFDACGVGRGDYVLVTIHRAENTDYPDRLSAIVNGLIESGQDIIFPVHPRTRQRLQSSLAGLPQRIRLVPPVGYLEMVWLERNCALIATDSGGVQKEAYFHGKPCVTLRDETEWLELVDAKWNRLAGTNSELIAQAIAEATPGDNVALYGMGNAATTIVNKIIEANT